ncbi:ABC transporter permease subunit [Desulfosporosinus shakirovi]|uniref:ABC transporter permease n=1 Tax=Desulfosporosinus shakirovi TaxID=2885154 RepID=UPI0037C171BE
MMDKKMLNSNLPMINTGSEHGQSKFAGLHLLVRAVKKFSPIGKAALVVAAIIVMMGIFAEHLSLFSNNLPSGYALEAPGKSHWLGTDDLGIDLWAQICYGARVSLMVGWGTALLAGVGGSLIGVVSGYAGGTVDKVIMRLTDLIIVLPELPMMIVLGAFFGPSLKNVILVLALFSWTEPARIVRSKILSIKQEHYVRAAKSYGAGVWHLIRVHFLPSLLPLVLVSMIRLMGRAIVAEAGLAFLGLGDPLSKSWGLILNHAINFKGIYFTEFWKWWVVSPITAISLMVVSIAFIGRELEKLVNSKM